MPAVFEQKLTTAQAARAIGVSEQSVRQWARSRVLRSELTPLGRLFDVRDVGRLIATREQQARERAAGRPRPRHIPAAEGGAVEPEVSKEGQSNG